jgi:archaellum component FlaF (FlaF/FlaG flagellin family)
MSAGTATQKETTESSDVFLDTDEDESSLPEVLSNTRLVSQDDTYIVEDVDVTEQTEVVRLIDRFPHKRQGRGSTIKKLQKDDIRTKVDEDITISLTTDHLSEYSEGRNSSLAPIDPITVEENGTERTYKFAKTVTKFLVSIQVKSKNGDRQTVYRNYSNRGLAFKGEEYIGETVKFTMSGSDLYLKDESEQKSEEAEVDDKTNFDRLISALKLGTPSVLVFASLELLRYFGLLTPLIRDTVPASAAVLILTFYVFVVTMYATLKNSSEEEETDDSVDISEIVSLNNDHIPITGEKPVREVEVESTFEDQTLTLSLVNVEESSEWTVETTEEDIFRDEAIVEFYTELGFDKSEQDSFTAYVSPKYDETIPSLKSGTTNKLYLYPEQPFD